MPDVIPAAPGWYLKEIYEDGETNLDPIIAWQVATTADGEATLLPFVDSLPGSPPFAHTEGSFKEHRRHVVYLPSHDPATGGEAT
ncbi:hypothetical protein [Actinacidiphila acidipaludis]|uniref:Uncharacterized protein n=1 Tax=Actinacidiphila acidipaludis TaxID=2873382 RepID=A0ABS7Q9W4_9ACTN|nr:hypothetical protein [Streptomyces acidipaludis]MBY8879753.1 hypothetical protein [Streptomyces acidipaludis]